MHPPPRIAHHRSPPAATAVTLRLAGLACAALLLGLAVYLTDREPGHALLIPSFATLRTGPLFGAAAGWLPSFVHVLALGLLSAAVWPSRGRVPYAACALWWLVDVAFEVGQHPRLAGAVADALQRALGDGPAASGLAGYFTRGRFDPADIVAATAGALVAAAVLHLSHARSRGS